MSGYKGRTGPNFSQYLSDLNTVSPTDYNFDDNDFSQDLAMFTNTDFTSLDVPSLQEDNGFNFDLSADGQGQTKMNYEDLLAGAGPSPDFSTGIENPSRVQAQQFFPPYTTPIQPAPTQGFPTVDQTSNTSPVSTPVTKRKAESSPPSDDVPADEKSRLAAEEDKRRRNTAASARFRVKKKQREQALERTLKETQDSNAKLEARVTQLEMENKWLKELITEKHGLSSKEEMAAAYQQYRKESEERDIKQESARVKGIGTK